MNSRHVSLAAAAAVLLTAAVFGGYYLGGRHAAPDGAKAPAAEARKPLYWHDPMVPGQRFDKPGKSPFMDMQLVPVYADAQADQRGVAIDPVLSQRLGVRTAEVVTGILAPALGASGNIAFDERDVVLVQARSTGYVERLYVRSPQEPVRQGQRLAELYMPEWVAAQEEFLAVRGMAGAGNGALLAAARQRMRLAGMDEAQIAAVDTGGKVQPRLIVSAPRSGVLTELAVREGATLAMGSPMFRINGLARVWVNAQVPEQGAAVLRQGTPAVVRVPALRDLELKGRIAMLLPQVSADTRTLTARIELANPDGRLVPGMLAQITFAPPQAKAVLLVPVEAVIRTGTRALVMVEQAAGRFAPVEVQTGAEGGGQIEVQGGLTAGQKVVVSGQFLIDSEASLKGTALRSAPTTPQHKAAGVIEHLTGQEVTLSHGPVPSLNWPAMTMDFQLAPGAAPVGLRPGARVSVEFHQQQDGSFEVTRMVPASGKEQP